MTNIKLDINYHTLCCILDCVQAAGSLVMNGETVLTLPCDSLTQEFMIISEIEDMITEILDSTEWE